MHSISEDGIENFATGGSTLKRYKDAECHIKESTKLAEVFDEYTKYDNLCGDKNFESLKYHRYDAGKDNHDKCKAGCSANPSCNSVTISDKYSLCMHALTVTDSAGVESNVGK